MLKQSFEALPRLVYEKDMRIRLAAALSDEDIFEKNVPDGINAPSDRTLPEAKYLDIRRFKNEGDDVSDEQEKYVKGYQNMERLKGFSAEEIPLRISLFRLDDTTCAMGITWDDDAFSPAAIEKLKHRISAMTGRYVPKADTVFELVLRQGVRHPDRKLLIFIDEEGRHEVSAGKLLKDVDTVAGFLKEKAGGYRRIAICGDTSYAWMLAFFAISATCGTAVILEPKLGNEQICERMEQVGADVLIGEEEILSGFLEEEYVGILLSDIEALAVEKDGEKAEGSLIKDLPKATPEDIAAIFFTSGTTGYGKAVPLTHNMLTSYVKNVVDLMGTVERALQFLPLYHIAGITTLLCDIHYGASAMIIRDYRLLVEAIATQGIKYAVLVPRLADMLLVWLRGQAKDPHETMEGFDLEYISIGGAKSNVDYTKEFAPFGIEAYDVYGMTESCGGMIFGNRPLEQMSVKIDENGELLVKGPMVFGGYLNDDEATSTVFKDGWFCTGDLARETEDGRIFIVGRLKNLIVLSNGENVSPEEIEGILQKSEYVDEVVVFEQDDRIAAEIFPGREVGTTVNNKIEDEVKRLLAGLPTYKQVANIILRKEPFPRNAMGKIVRRQED
ncbi:MAG: acyl--CoA ligase [Lachnospiraceae bacterium]|nr:acyl--CoA ligase [Lachnospiraceae bacterium]